MQFHGETREALTLQKAVQGSLSIHQKNWKNVLTDTVSALLIVHKSGYFHNDVKANNTFLGKAHDNQYKAVLIDFGKSQRISTPKKYNLNESQKGITKKRLSIFPQNY